MNNYRIINLPAGVGDSDPARRSDLYLDLMRDVLIASPSGGDILRYNNTTQLWENTILPMLPGPQGPKGDTGRHPEQLVQQ